MLHFVHKNVYENITLQAEQLTYTSVPHYEQSDHKPVVSEFAIKVKNLVAVPCDFVLNLRGVNFFIIIISYFNYGSRFLVTIMTDWLNSCLLKIGIWMR